MFSICSHYKRCICPNGDRLCFYAEIPIFLVQRGSNQPLQVTVDVCWQYSNSTP